MWSQLSFLGDLQLSRSDTCCQGQRSCVQMLTWMVGVNNSTGVCQRAADRVSCICLLFLLKMLEPNPPRRQLPLLCTGCSTVTIPHTFFLNSFSYAIFRCVTRAAGFSLTLLVKKDNFIHWAAQMHLLRWNVFLYVVLCMSYAMN